MDKVLYNWPHARTHTHTHKHTLSHQEQLMVMVVFEYMDTAECKIAMPIKLTFYLVFLTINGTTI